MNLPNRFLADLPPEATLTGTIIRDACQALKRNREQHLVNRPSAQLLGVIASTAENWLDSEYPFRRMALEDGPASTGFNRGTLERGLDGFFRQLTFENLVALLEQELGHAERLDAPCSTPAEARLRQKAMTCGPELLVHIAAGNIPNPTLLSLVLGLLTRSAQFIKCARGASLLPRLFAHSLHETDPSLASCLEIAEWRGGDIALEAPLFNEADCVTTTGGDEAIQGIRARISHSTRFLAYGHRLSFGFIASSSLSALAVKKLASAVVDDVVAWNQLGCLSPHAVYVQSGGAMSAEGFAELLAAELERRESEEPAGELSVEDSAVISSRRDLYRIRAAASTETHLWCSEGSTAWTVVFEASPQFQVSCLNRFIYVKPVASLTDALQAADAVRGQVSTVGLSASAAAIEDLVRQLARWGVTRVCPLGQMQNPPLTWRHDGRPPLGDMVIWTGWEQ